MEEKKKEPILLLSESAINQIQAGEVIEDAASVVKELVENAIDAGATEIRVETTGGGQGLIVVKDDGHGMGKEDLLVAVERHTTSKIRQAEDLFRLTTLGFRGEALASVASVSKMKIHSSASETEGTLLSMEGGKVLSCRPLPRRQGTTVEVSSLFFNLPARKKFQKSLKAETAEVSRVLLQAALGYPEIAFQWESEGEVVWAFKRGEERVVPLLGTEFLSSVTVSRGDDEGYHLSAHFVKALYHRPNRTGHTLFVNRRPVVSPWVASCVQEAYGTRLPQHRFPLFLLSLTVPPERIDVNIHPRKREIRFHEEKRIKELIERAVQEGLEEKRVPEAPPKISFPPPQAFSLSSPLPYERKEESVEKRVFAGSLLTLFGPYIFVKENDEEILVVDGARACRRIFYEKLQGREDKIAIQHLLFPLPLEKSGSERAKLECHLPLLQEMGILVRTFGGNSFVIDGYPDIFSEPELLSFLDSLLEEVGEAFSSQSKKRAIEIFCRSIKKRVSTHEEGAKLVEELFLCAEPHLCPERKATYFRLNPQEVSKWF